MLAFNTNWHTHITYLNAWNWALFLLPIHCLVNAFLRHLLMVWVLVSLPATRESRFLAFTWPSSSLRRHLKWKSVDGWACSFPITFSIKWMKKWQIITNTSESVQVERKQPCVLGGNVNEYSHYKEQYEVPQKSRHKSPIWFSFPISG